MGKYRLPLSTEAGVGYAVSQTKSWLRLNCAIPAILDASRLLFTFAIAVARGSEFHTQCIDTSRVQRATLVLRGLVIRGVATTPTGGLPNLPKSLLTRYLPLGKASKSRDYRQYVIMSLRNSNETLTYFFDT